jgi:hypothetical protein
MIFTLNMDNSQVKAYTNKLQQMHRSNFPIVIRQTLNDLAFDVKQKELLRHADKEFILRSPSFFKKFSGVKKANGFDIKSMRSEVGIVESTEQGGKAAGNLTKQEFGGIMNGEAIYLDVARMSGSKGKKIRMTNALNKTHVKGAPSKARGRKAQFVANALVALREDKYLKMQTKKGGEALFDVKSVSQNIKSRKIDIKLIPIASYKEGRMVNIPKNPFFYPASLSSYEKQGYFFIKNAEKRLNK